VQRFLFLESLNWQVDAPYWAAMVLLGYLIGSVPFGLVLTKLRGGPDLRSIGSGNIGATNVLRTGNKGLAALTLLLDALKGTLAALIGWRYGPQMALLGAFGAFLGHLFPVWLRFKGGKGVATFLGCLLGIAWKAALVFVAVWIGVAFVTRYSSLAALVASVGATLALWLLGEGQAAYLFGLLTVLIVFTHRENIARLLNGSESKIGASKSSAAAGKAQMGS
jgi:acyl phosphate:glycerol-3-phosphate acyltransferase